MARTVVPAAGCGYMLTLVRATGERPFAPRHGRLVGAALRELTPHLGRSLWLTTQPNLSGLSDRLRGVLGCLLDGDGEKQAAARRRPGGGSARPPSTTTPSGCTGTSA